MNDANHQFNLNFSYDSVTLYDGDSIAAPELVKYCGEVWHSASDFISSSSNKVLINFQSDGGGGAGEGQGFELKYLSYSKPPFIVTK